MTAGAAQHDGAAVLALGHLVYRVGEAAGERRREGVAAGRAVEGEDVDPAFGPGQQLVVDRQLPAGAAIPIT
jgi:hypothetical protein